MTQSTSPSHDRYERYDTTLPSHQRQQQPSLPRRREDVHSPRQDDRSSTASSQKSLRRTPNFLARPSPPRRIHLEAASVGISPEPLFASARDSASGREEQEQELRRVLSPQGQLSQELSEDLDHLEEASTLPPSLITPRASSATAAATSARAAADRPESHPFVRISKHTKSAILWALEEALRHPNPFSPDLIEESASMADLMSGGVPATTNGLSATMPRPTATSQTGSPSQGIRGPRVIMRERQEREARQRAEREQLERARAEEEARLLEEQQRRAAAAERRASAAGAATSSEIPPNDPVTQRRQQRQQQSQGNAPSQAAPGRAQQPASQTAPLRPTRVPTSSQAPQGFSAIPPGASAAAPVPPPAESSTAAAAAVATRAPRTSFPHAFERWEALSAHWEGMTSFWIRKLQENTDEINQNPISAQLTRQVGDLSAAGANLFHAVVELQRLRASSERKFQRWFFETRAEMERNQEINAMLEAALAEERDGRAAAIRSAVANTESNSKVQKQLTEMRKELAISKEEARRAWEELGRREQEERDRTISLQQGLPTVVGGVQVVPMTQGVSRQTSARDPRSHSQHTSPEYVTSHAQGYPEYTQAHSATAGGRGPSAPQDQDHGGLTTPDQDHRGPSTPQDQDHRGPAYGPSSDGGYSEGEYMIDANGNFVRDSQGHKMAFHSPRAPPKRARESDQAAEEYETPASQPAPPATSYPPSSSHWVAGQPPPPADYTGEGYIAPGWETMPRHHHPTRLSDVLEEDERSRTSASQVSRA